MDNLLSLLLVETLLQLPLLMTVCGFMFYIDFIE